MKERRQSSRERPNESLARSRPRLAYAVALVLILAASVAVFLGKNKWFTQSQIDTHSAHHSAGHASGATQPNAESAALVSTNSTTPPGAAPDGMVWIPGGTFWMGCDDCDMPDTQPVHLVAIDGFWIDRTPVTNAQF